MKLKTFNLFKKFMALAMSPVESERLAALDKANTLLNAEGLTWERVLNRSITVIDEVEESPDSFEDIEPRGHGKPLTLEAAFERINHSNLTGGSSSFTKMLADIEEQWRRRGSLSPKQKEIVITTAQRIDDSGRYRSEGR